MLLAGVLRLLGLFPLHNPALQSPPGRFAIVTGSNTGLGFRTAANLARRGIHVILACRTVEKAERAADLIRAELCDVSGAGELTGMSVELADLNSVREFAEQYIQQFKRLDILVNNAGLTASGRTEQGLELKIGVNYVGHFALTRLLLPVLLQTPGSRVVNLSSVMHHFGDASSFNSESIRAEFELESLTYSSSCLLYTSDAADEEDSVDLGGRRTITKNKSEYV
eukprot:TRINITY_DN19632_c0_g1_i2.p1 TRINITY_DN19632_c0_g1~~TRINITY_DN19632_c0_g1_i2.p1  ORF type:complete len:225 (+),score=59.49 TRINITY_DN19632_c0_g1_i2:112-786(+)